MLTSTRNSLCVCAALFRPMPVPRATLAMRNIKQPVQIEHNSKNNSPCTRSTRISKKNGCVHTWCRRRCPCSEHCDNQDNAFYGQSNCTNPRLATQISSCKKLWNLLVWSSARNAPQDTQRRIYTRSKLAGNRTAKYARSDTCANTRSAHMEIGAQKLGRTFKFSRFQERGVWALSNAEQPAELPFGRKLHSKFSASKQTGQASIEIVTVLVVTISFFSIFFRHYAKLEAQWQREVRKSWFKQK